MPDSASLLFDVDTETGVATITLTRPSASTHSTSS